MDFVVRVFLFVFEQSLDVGGLDFAHGILREFVGEAPALGDDDQLKVLRKEVPEELVHFELPCSLELFLSVLVEGDGCRQVLALAGHGDDAYILHQSRLSDSHFDFGEGNAFFFDFDDGTGTSE